MNPTSIEMFNADASRLHYIQQECEVMQIEEQDAFGSEDFHQYQ